MAAIQIMSATIGWRTRRGLAHSLGEHLPSPVHYALVALLALANTINIAADLAAMAEVVRLAFLDAYGSERAGSDGISTLAFWRWTIDFAHSQVCRAAS